MDTSRLLHPKPRLPALLKQDRTRARHTADERENVKVRTRSHQRCERRELLAGVVVRCLNRACEINHLLGGHGRRAIGDSRKAIRKMHLCHRCHVQITNHILQRVRGGVPHWTDVYRRVR